MTLLRTRSRITGIPTDTRGIMLLRAFGASRVDGRVELSPARARKVEALYRAGFTAELRESRPVFRRGDSAWLRLPEAMIVAEAVL